MGEGTNILHECLKCGKHINCKWLTETYNEVVNCPACMGAAVDVNFLHKYKTPELEPKKPYLKIELDDLQSAPKVFYKGDEINLKTAVSFDWKTRDETMISNNLNFTISHLVESEMSIVKTINLKSQHIKTETHRTVGSSEFNKGITSYGN